MTPRDRQSKGSGAQPGSVSSLRGGGAKSGTQAPDKPLTISQLANWVRYQLEAGVGAVWVEGEISNWKQHSTSGHCYFTLKDDTAQISAVMWRSTAARVPFEPRNGLMVEARGLLTFYEAQGRAQIVVEEIEESGVGRLWKQFLELKARLQREGLFDESRKRPLPALPARVGVVTSGSGAALRDILNILGRRFAGIEIIVWPVRVQGEGAAEEIAHAIERMGALRLCDVIIAGRGGGSMEDLWAFNEEIVARAVAACPVPVVSAVGHETDFTICDFVADVRAPTPSAAAEIVVAEKTRLAESVRVAAGRLGRALANGLRQRRAHVESLAQSYALAEPLARLRQCVMRRDELAERLSRAMRSRLQAHENNARRVGELQARLNAARRRAFDKIERDRAQIMQILARMRARLREQLARSEARRREVEEKLRRLQTASLDCIRRARREVEAARDQLAALAPERVLQRGYAIVRRARDGRILRNPRQVRINDQITAQLAEGSLRAFVARNEDDLFS